LAKRRNPYIFNPSDNKIRMRLKRPTDMMPEEAKEYYRYQLKALGVENADRIANTMMGIVMIMQSSFRGGETKEKRIKKSGLTRKAAKN
jgi:hypothetical protein